MSETSEMAPKGEIIPIEFGGKVIAAKRNCTCGGDVEIKDNSDGPGKIAVCRRCGARLQIGGA